MKTKQRLHYAFLVTLIVIFCISCQKKEVKYIKTLSGKTIMKSDIDSLIDNQMDSLNIKGISIAIINDGEIVYHKAKGIADVYKDSHVDNETLFEAASLSKPVFAFFVMKQVEKGLIALDTPLYKYMPYPDIEYDERYKLITARNVLCHTTGFPNFRGHNKLDMKFTPGIKFSYSGEAYIYLAKVIAHVNNLNWSNLDSLFQKEIAEPLNLQHFHFGIDKYIANHLASAHDGNKIVYDSSWDRKILHPAAGLHAESINYSNFLISIMENKGLEEESINELLENQIELPMEDGIRKIFGYIHWTLGFAIKPSKKGAIHCHGGFNSGYTASFAFHKAEKFGYVFFTNANQCMDLHKNIEKVLFQ